MDRNGPLALRSASHYFKLNKCPRCHEVRSHGGAHRQVAVESLRKRNIKTGEIRWVHNPRSYFEYVRQRQTATLKNVNNVSDACVRLGRYVITNELTFAVESKLPR